MDAMPTISCEMTEEARTAVNRVVDALLSDEPQLHGKAAHFLEHDAIALTLHAVATELCRRWKAEPRKKAGRRAHAGLRFVLGLESTQEALRQCSGYDEHVSRKFTAFLKRINTRMSPPLPGP